MCHRVLRSSSSCLAAVVHVTPSPLMWMLSSLASMHCNPLTGKIISHLSESALARRSCVRDDLRDDLVCERRIYNGSLSTKREQTDIRYVLLTRKTFYR